MPEPGIRTPPGSPLRLDDLMSPIRSLHDATFAIGTHEMLRAPSNVSFHVLQANESDGPVCRARSFTAPHKIVSGGD